MTSGHPIVIRRAEPADAEAIHQTFLGPRVIAGTLQLPYPSLEMWRKRLAEVPADDYILVATIAGEVIGSLGLHAASKSPRRRHVGALGMSVRDDRQRRNLAAMRLYRKFGFAIEGTCRAYAFRDGGYVDAYQMARLHPALKMDEVVADE